MNGYLLQRKDGKFVARKGLQSSYTRNLQEARVFPSRRVAYADSCIYSERVIALRDVLDARGATS